MTPLRSNPAAPASVRIAVVIPSYRRPELLTLCLEAVSSQSEPPEAIVVVHRSGDAATAMVLDDWPAVTAIEVNTSGVVPAMRAGVSATTTEFVAFTDDDAMPRVEWLATLRHHLCDATVGAVGGRDIVDRPTQTGPPTDRVGQLERWGRVTGNHHLGRGPARDVAVLKGANMAFRRAALSLPTGLRGSGAQVDFELACCLAASANGWRLVYDPSAIVDHTVGPRFDPDQRGHPDRAAISDAAYNRLAIMLSLRPALGRRRAAFGLLVGERSTPGVLRAAVAAIRGEGDVVRRLLPSMSGQMAALADAGRGRRVRMLPSAGG